MSKIKKFIFIKAQQLNFCCAFLNKYTKFKQNITMKKIISIFLIVILLTAFLIVNIIINNTFAESKRYTYESSTFDTNKYPGYKEKIDAIKAKHPTWNFIIMETGLDFEQVIKAQYTGHFGTPKNLIQGKSGGWICSICGDRVYDTGNWKCASEQSIRHYMDTRNWLVDSPYLFQFLQTDYLETTDDKVYGSLNGTFLYSRENAKVINKVCKEKNANPYYVIARLIQEQGSAGGATSKMVDTDGTVYYNLFNIGATGNSKEEVYKNALARAKKEGWTSIEKCLSDGITFLFSAYINNKQNSIYLNKFDVEPYGGLYVRQYMQNVEAPKSEGTSMYNKMKSADLLGENLTFIIPVYENMPKTSSVSPDDRLEAYPKNIRVKEGHSNVMIRAARSTTSSIVGKIENSSVVVLSVERYSDGWHKVILEDGTTGYVKFNTSYLEEIDDLTNCYEEVTINKQDTILRAGPGYSQIEITALDKGQVVHRIDNTGRYNFDGKIWDRVILSDSRQGFIARDCIEVIDYAESFIVNAEGGLYLRQTPAGEIIRKLDKGTIVTRLEAGQKLGNYTWDKVITEDGVIGYVAREYLIKVDGEEVPDGNETNSVNNNIVTNDIENENILNEVENNIEQNNIVNNENVVNSTIPDNSTNTGDSNTTNETNNEVSNETGEDNSNETEDDEIETDRILIVEPSATASSIKDAIIKRKDEVISGNSMVATGDIASIGDEKYTIVKKGDCNGDGYVKANDYLIIKDYIMETGTAKLQGAYKHAADVTGDSQVKANDYLKIKDHIMYGVEV